MKKAPIVAAMAKYITLIRMKFFATGSNPHPLLKNIVNLNLVQKISQILTFVNKKMMFKRGAPFLFD
jgi:hypothetical protein